jgi:hypothetical protein
MKIRIVLKKGAYAGKTVKLCGVQFVDGEADISHVPTEKMRGLIKQLERYYQAEVIYGERETDTGRADGTNQEMECEVLQDGGPTDTPTDDSSPDDGSHSGPKGLRTKRNRHKSAKN